MLTHEIGNRNGTRYRAWLALPAVATALAAQRGEQNDRKPPSS